MDSRLATDDDTGPSHPTPRTPLTAAASRPDDRSTNDRRDSDASSGFSDMNHSEDGHRRRKALQMAKRKGSGTGSLDGESKQDRSRGRRGAGAMDEEDLTENVSDDSNDSKFTPSTSDDVELDKLHADEQFSDDEEMGLTRQDRRKKRRRKVKNTMLDERVSGSSKPRTEQSSADKNVLKASIINVLLIASWYCFSLSISIYNKWMFSPKYLDFHFPLFTTCMHMLVQFALASLVLFFFPHFRPQAQVHSDPHDHTTKKPAMTRFFYLTRIAPCGIATGLDIGLGNTSLKFITLTFFTMCKSSALAFVLLFAFLFRLETPSVKLIFIIATMTIGVIMMVAGETEFSALGFVLVISSAFFSGFRWSLTQILLLRSPATSNPFSGIFFLAPIMFLSLAIIAVPVEGFRSLGIGLQHLTEKKGVVEGIGILLFPGCLAFLMTASEFALLQRTSVVTLSICGIFKEVVTISAAGIVFHDPLTPINISGLLVTIASIAAYNYIKIEKMRRTAQEEAARLADKDGEAGEGLLSTSRVEVPSNPSQWLPKGPTRSASTTPDGPKAAGGRGKGSGGLHPD